MTAPYRIGMDIGGTKIEAVALDDAGEVAASARLPTLPGDEAVVATAEQVLAELARLTGTSARDFASIGIGIPGQVDRERGEVLHAYNLGVERLALAPILTERTGIPTAMDNDVTAAALGAAHLMGLGDSVAYLNIGTGLAAGFVFDGQVLRGARGVTGEIGHTAVDASARKCWCGQTGCLETLASGAALKAYWPAGGEHPGRTLLPAVEAGDPDARAAFDDLVRGAATAIRIIVQLVDPHTVVIGGGLRLLGAPLLDGITARLDGWAAESGFIAELGIPGRIRVLPDGSPAAAVGAALAGAE